MTGPWRFLFCVLAISTLNPAWAEPASAPAASPVGPTVVETLFATGFPATREALLKLAKERKDLEIGEALLIPDSRSLQRAVVSCSHPRLVFSVSKKGDSLTPPSFIGHAETAHQAEIITWNPSRSRYEFLIATGLDSQDASVKPALVPADRAVCLSCHQNAAPIFPRFPWSETTVNSAARSWVTKCQTAEGHADEVKALGLEASSGSGEGLFFDFQVRSANRIEQAGRVCQICESDVACRRALLAQAIKNAGGDMTNLWQLDNRMAAEPLEHHWPADGFAYPSSVLPNRDPLDEQGSGGRSSIFVSVNDSRIFFNDVNEARENFTYSEGFAAGLPNTPFPGIADSTPAPMAGDPLLRELTLIGIRSLADPLSARPMVGRILPSSLEDPASLLKFSDTRFLQNGLTSLGSVCFGFSDQDVILLGKNRQRWLTNALNTPSPILSGAWPPPKAELIKFLNQPAPAHPTYAVKAVQKPLPIDHEIHGSTRPVPGTRAPGRDDSESLAHLLSSQLSATPAVPSLDPHRALANFQKYCSECHEADTAALMGHISLPLESLDALRAFGGDGRVSAFLRDGRMPPKSASLTPTPTEIAEMIEALN